MSGGAITCSSEGCTEPAVETLFLRDQIGHVHDCVSHAAMCPVAEDPAWRLVHGAEGAEG